MTPKEFADALKELADCLGTKFPDSQKTAWWKRLKGIPAPEFQAMVGTMVENMETLPFRWNLVAAIKNLQRSSSPSGAPASVAIPSIRSDEEWAHGLAKAKEAQRELRSGRLQRLSAGDIAKVTPKEKSPRATQGDVKTDAV